MVLLKSVSETQRQVAGYVRERRLLMELTQAGLAERSGVTLPTLRKFEQRGVISLEFFLKLLWVVGGLEELIQVVKPSKPDFTSIEEVIDGDRVATRKKGRKR